MEHREKEHEAKTPASLINKNVIEETEAINDYYELLGCEELTDEDRDKIIEIIADEKNHQLTLTAMARNYDGGIKATDDGREEAIKGLTEGEEKMPKIRKDLEDGEEAEEEEDTPEFEVVFLEGLTDKPAKGKGGKNARA